MTIAVCFQWEKVSCGYVECDEERGTGDAVDTMTTVWMIGLGWLLMLCFGVLLGSTWTVQVVNRQYRRLAIERKRLNATRLAMQATSPGCTWCGKADRLSGQKQFRRR